MVVRYKGEDRAGFSADEPGSKNRQATRPDLTVTGDYNLGYIIPNDHVLSANTTGAPETLITGDDAVDKLVQYAQDLINRNSNIFHPGGGPLGEEGRHWQSSQLGGEIFNRWEVSEVTGLLTSQAAAAAAFFGFDISGEISTMIGRDSALTNFFGTIGREFDRNPGKSGINGKFSVNNLLLHLQNPNIVNADQDPGTKGFSSFGSLFGGGADESQGPFKGDVASRTKRLGPSLLSLLPDPTSFTIGKGKLFNIIAPLVGGGSATFGEQLIPLTGLALDRMGGKPADGIPTALNILARARAGLLNTVSDGTRNKEDLEPYSTVAMLENPIYLLTEKGTNTFEQIGKNKFQLKGLPDNLILRSVEPQPPGAGIMGNIALNVPTLGPDEGEKPYRKPGEMTITRENVAEMERLLEKEYVPFYFHDMRTNEIIAFHAFLKSLNETYGPSWNSESFYGRVDNVQTYAGNTARRITLSFMVAALNRVDFDIMWKKVNKLVTLVYPQFGKRLVHGDPATSIPHSAPIIGAPVCRMRIGDLIKTNLTMRAISNETGLDGAAVGKAIGTDGTMPDKGAVAFVTDFNTYSKGLAGVITDITFDYNTARWETAMNHVAPQMIDISLSFTAIHDIAPGLEADGTNRAALYNPVAPKDDPLKQNAVLSGYEIFGNSLGPSTLNNTMTEK